MTAFPYKHKQSVVREDNRHSRLTLCQEIVNGQGLEGTTFRWTWSKIRSIVCIYRLRIDCMERLINQETIMLQWPLNPLPNNNDIWPVGCRRLWKTLREKEKLLVRSNFFLFPQCFLPYQMIVLPFHQCLKYSLKTLSIWDSGEFGVW